jgi:acetylornithine deacetylase
MVGSSPAPLSPLEARVAAAVDVDGLIDAAVRLVRIPSWNGRETPAQELMVRLMEDAGLEVDTWQIDLDEVARHPAHSTEIPRESALGVVGTLPGTGGGRSLILNAHVDVVPPGDEALWSRPPFAGVVDDGRLYGRGALDLKGPLAAGLHALIALRSAGVEPAGPLHLMSVVGEEDGGVGTLAALLRGWRADGAIVLEPTELAVAPAQAGCLNFRIHVPGRAAHGAVRDEGVSALEKWTAVHAAIRALEARRNRRLAGDPLFARHGLPFAISVGTIRGGDWASTVPDRVTVEGRMGIAPGEDPDAARHEMARALEQAADADPRLADRPALLEWWGGRFLAARTDPNDPLVSTVRGAAEAVLRRPVPLEGVPYGADMGLLSGVGGIPTVLFGAGDIRRAHRPDEWVAVDELVALARTLAVAAVRFCGTNGAAGGRSSVPG